MLQLESVSADSIRLVIFLSLFSILLLLQWLVPRRGLSPQRFYHQLDNLIMVVLGNGLIRLAVPFSLLWLASSGWNNFGLLYFLELGYWLKIAIGVIFLDCAIYWQHRLTHSISLLWRLHRVHHCDSAMEVTTALRFHPVELLLSYLLKMALVLLLGVDVVTVLLFEIILSSSAMFSHSNLYLPLKLDKYLRLLIVTPDMHRIHHSEIKSEHNSNYGFCFSLWDRLFASYQACPQLGQQAVTVGLTGVPSGNILKLLMLPFRAITKVQIAQEAKADC